MVSTPVAIGPFTGGLNNYSDPAAIGDNECAVLENFDVDLDGTLVSRPPIFEQSFSWPISNILGSMTDINGVLHLIIAHVNDTWLYNTEAVTHTSIANFAATAAVVYQNKIWLVSNDPGKDGGYWNPTGGGFTAVADMPKGITACVYKERMFIATANSRVYFSSPADPTSWSSSDFFDARSGDNQRLVKIAAFSGQIVIFKTESTYIFAYDANPSRGNVQEVSVSVGADNDQCVTEQDGIIYVYHNQSVYAINNWKWERINLKVVFDDPVGNLPVAYTRPYSLSILGDRLCVRHHTKLFLFGLKTRVWTVWTTSHKPDYWIRSPEKDSEGRDVYFAGSYSYDLGGRIYRYVEGHDDTTGTEDFTAKVVSKMYDYQVPYSFKRLFWWGVDLTAMRRIDVTLLPQVHSSQVKWGDLAAKTWGELKSAGATWGRPLDVSLNVSDYMDASYTSGTRLFVRFIKALRFRKIQFQVTSVLDGGTRTGPLRIYSMVANISNRQLVPKKVN